MGRERQGKGCETENGDNGQQAEKPFCVLHGVCLRAAVNRVRQL
jgi:hypothetical protein